MTMAEMLEESDWPGMHIPVIPVIGEEVRVGRDVYRHGIVRYARDLQRMVNYYAGRNRSDCAAAEGAVDRHQEDVPGPARSLGNRQHGKPSVLEYTPGPERAGAQAAARGAAGCLAGHQMGKARNAPTT
jgi:hypothetical protein